MRGTLHCQVEGLYHYVAKGIGVSRHELKANRIADTLIHSDNTRVAYLNVWHRIANYAFQKHNITQIEELTADIVEAWLQIQVKKGLAPFTIGQYCAAIMKLQHSLIELDRKQEKDHAKKHVR